MSITTWKVKQGSYHRRLAIDLTEITTAGALDVTFQMRKRATGSPLVVDNLGTIDGANRVSYQFVAPQLDEPGTFRLEVVLRYIDGEERAPTEGFVTVIVEPSIA